MDSNFYTGQPNNDKGIAVVLQWHPPLALYDQHRWRAQNAGRSTSNVMVSFHFADAASQMGDFVRTKLLGAGMDDGIQLGNAQIYLDTQVRLKQRPVSRP